MSELDVGRLTEIVDLIKDEAESIVHRVSASRVKIGNLLAEARNKFKGDNEFGKWRQENLPFLTQRETSKLIGYARLIAKRPSLEALPESTGFALITADDKMLDEVEDRIRDDDPPTRREVESKTKTKKTPPPPVSDRILAYQECINKDHGKRIEQLAAYRKGLSDSEWAYMVFGLDPDPQCYPNDDVVEAICERILGPKYIDNQIMKIVAEAKAIVVADRSNF